MDFVEVSFMDGIELKNSFFFSRQNEVLFRSLCHVRFDGKNIEFISLKKVKNFIQFSRENVAFFDSWNLTEKFVPGSNFLLKIEMISLCSIFRLKAIKKQMGHVKAETDEEKDDVKELGQDLMRRNEQLAQVRTKNKGLIISHRDNFFFLNHTMKIS